MNAASTSSGSLWWQGHPETVLPYVKGWLTALTSNQFPVFSTSTTNWNESAVAGALGKGGGADVDPASTNGKADYLMVGGHAWSSVALVMVALGLAHTLA